jgi:NADPH:quinone reductase-like Zn-dependent oxidoreductase
MTTLAAAGEDGGMKQAQHVLTDSGAESWSVAGSEQDSTMQAIVQDRYGSADVLHLSEIEKPVIADDEVLVRVRAAGVHFGDVHMMTGMPYLMRIMGFGLRGPKARVRGTDVAGIVEAVGQNVSQFRPGDAVFGSSDGAFAEYARARADKLAPKPANLTFVQAAAVPTSAVVALHALRDAGQLQLGQKVLIVGASGGVGMFAVQIAKSFGSEVTGVCSAKKMDTVRSIGADHVIDYTREDFTRTGQQYDLIVDTGGNRSLSDLRAALTKNGRLVLVGSEGGDRWIGAGLRRSFRAAVLSPFVSQKLRSMVAWANAADLHVLKDLVEAGKITPIVDRTYSLSETADAIRYQQSGHAVGKVVITV